MAEEKEKEKEEEKQKRKKKRSLKKYTQVYVRDAFPILSEINRSRTSYMSIFENSHMAYFKQLHEKFGTVFTLGLSAAHKNETLNDITACYREEFENNGSWLRFAFHRRRDGDDVFEFTYNSAKRYYDYFVKQMFRIAGGQHSIDRVTGFAGFYPGDEAMRGFSECSYGILGIYVCPEDINWLGTKNNIKLGLTGRCFDERNMIEYINRKNVINIGNAGHSGRIRIFSKSFVILEIFETEACDAGFRERFTKVCQYVHCKKYIPGYIMYHMNEIFPDFK